ncbi:MAG: NUDIX hydrolase, partial [Chthoniobacterales bacterium]
MNSNGAPAEPKGWATLGREIHYRDAHLLVATETVRTPSSGQIRGWTVVRRKAAVVIAPLTLDGKLVLIRQERIPIRTAIWEVPAGQIDDASEEHDARGAETVARRELREETGFELAPDGEMIPLGRFYSSPGFTDERAWFFLARGVIEASAGHSHKEFESILDCRAYDSREIADMIRRDEIQDANTLSICAKLVARGFLALP